MAIISKVGGDAAGNSIKAELLEEGIDTRCLLFSDSGPSPTTYIIVDAAGNPLAGERPVLDEAMGQGSRWCIPGGDRCHDGDTMRSLATMAPTFTKMHGARWDEDMHPLPWRGYHGC